MSKIQEVPSNEELRWGFRCPECGSAYFGSWHMGPNFTGPIEYECHDQFGRGCRWKGPESECSIYERVRP